MSQVEHTGTHAIDTCAVDVTMLLQGEIPDVQIGYHRAFELLAADGTIAGYRAFPYRGARTQKAWDTLWDEVVQHMRDRGSNVLHLQNFHWKHAVDPRPAIARVRALPQRPVVTTSCGDGFGPRCEPPPRSLLQAASVADATFTTSMGRLASRLVRSGARRVTLIPHSACDVRFGRTAPPIPSDAREFDVVFVGNNHPVHNVSRRLYWSNRTRYRMTRALALRYGTRFAVFGHGWESLPGGQGPVAMADQVAACQRARVVFGGYPHSWEPFYLSDRPFVQALSAVPIVELRVPRIDAVLADGSEWLLASDLDEVVHRIDALLDGRLDGDAIGQAGAQAVRTRHMSTHRVRLMTRIFAALLAARDTDATPVCPPIDYFVPGTDPAVIAEATARW